MTLAETQALFHAAVTQEDGNRSLEIQRCFTGHDGRDNSHSHGPLRRGGRRMDARMGS
jgi:hypothetical protein